MALLPEIFQPSEVSNTSFDPIPKGWYEAELVKSELKTTKAKDGKYLAFTFKVISGDHEGRLVFTNLNIVNKNEMAVKIAQSDLKAICLAVGRDEDEELEDTIDLHDVAIAIKVTVTEETAAWPAKNEIKGYRALEDSPL